MTDVPDLRDKHKHNNEHKQGMFTHVRQHKKTENMHPQCCRVHGCSHWRNKQNKDKNKHNKKENVSLLCACTYFMHVHSVIFLPSYFTSVNHALEFDWKILQICSNEKKNTENTQKR